jgi:enoyl-CoA hydratase
MSDTLKLDVQTNGIATLTIDRAEKKNAMTFAMLAEFTGLVKQAGDDDAVRVLIVTGVPGAFCAGTDLSDLNAVPGKQRGLRGAAEERSAWWPLVACPKPVVGAIDGPAVGMGAEFTSQCDVRIATPRARFAWNFVHRGLVPDTGAGTWLLPKLIGLPAALRLLYSGDFLSAEAAHEMGYVAELVEPEGLAAAAQTEAERFLRGSPFSIQRIKALTYEGLTKGVDDHMRAHTDALRECFASEDHQEGVSSFLERREPRFTGR